ncbi:hypothetical protein [Leptospira brenneri]|uniref:hypothetical protein n=1 Tax=Leptospira brenneri TaxID=2023182 RepID=UPI000C2A0555|nr:hypothetical protein [Leptospira brenneri]PJZ43667.1 hypothetical protein CH361_19250 [Leptospira brenneri]
MALNDDPFEPGIVGVIPPTLVTLKQSTLTQADVGKALKVTANKTVGLAANNDVPFGQLSSVESGIAAVKVAGVLEFEYSGTAPTLGLITVQSDAAGKLKVAASGLSVRVISVDTSASKFTFIL